MNENITKYIEKFIKAEANPEFAVFINGDWGTGKTHFIKALY